MFYIFQYIFKNSLSTNVNGHHRKPTFTIFKVPDTILFYNAQHMQLAYQNVDIAYLYNLDSCFNDLMIC